MTKRTWFITGVSSGFGREMTQQLLARGDRVAGTVRKLKGMDELAAKYGERLWLAELDVTDTPAIRRVVDRAFAELGQHKQLSDRLAALDAQRELAFSTDAPPE